MLAVLLIGVISIAWGVIGLVLTVAPMAWIAFAKKSLHDPWQRFWVTQGMLLIGLVLIIGTATLQGFWFWVGCGTILVVKACVILGSAEGFRDRLIILTTSQSMWVYRGSGLLTLIFGFLLAADTILHG